MKKYELALVIEPTLTDEKVKAVVGKIEDLILSEKGKVTSKDIWPKKTLAYKIAKHREAYYAILKIEVANIPPSTNRKIKLQEGIIRYLLINQ
ncbi:30S ribosomal protein S6 [Candidatus Gottesmanbacteria bacterium]|nr:30S ribosomal protein S6 [Candidatus Gottesmanbacteria bacterium]